MGSFYNKKLKAGETIINTDAYLEGDAIIIRQTLSIVSPSGKRIRTEDRIQITPSQLEDILKRLSLSAYKGREGK